ncbi:hypothetical protein GCM10020256_34200 [Streptomyces thermocoprophilus]
MLPGRCRAPRAVARQRESGGRFFSASGGHRRPRARRRPSLGHVRHRAPAVSAPQSRQCAGAGHDDRRAGVPLGRVDVRGLPGDLAGPLAVEQPGLGGEPAGADRVERQQQPGVLGGGQRHPAAEGEQQLAPYEQGGRVDGGRGGRGR